MLCDVHRQNTLKVGSSGRGVFRGPCACPLSADPNLYDGIAFFAVLLIFFSPRTSKFRQSLTKNLQLLGTLPLDPTEGLPFPDHLYAPLFAHSKYATACLYKLSDGTVYFKGVDRLDVA